MQIITTAIIKGGAGKTTTTAALAQAAAHDGKKVLCIDMDPQANLSFFIGANPNRPGALQLISGTDPKSIIQQTEQGIDIITSNPNLATVTTSRGSAKRLQQAIKPIKNNYDFIFIDTPPQMGELTYNALQACTGLLIPLEADNSSLQGLYQITDVTRQISRSNTDISIIGIIITRYEGRTKLDRSLRDAIEKTGKELRAPLLQTIRKGIAVKESQSMQLSLYEYAPKSKPAADYMELYNMIKN